MSVQNQGVVSYIAYFLNDQVQYVYLLRFRTPAA